MNRLLSVLGLAACVWLGPALVAAQDDPQPSPPQQPPSQDPPPQEQPTDDRNEQLDEAARLTFVSAREAFVAGDYETALARFRQAYQLSARPGLLYNIAQTLDRLRRDEETVVALRDYLEAFPSAPNRNEVEARIRVLEAALARRQPAEPEPDPDPGPNAVGTGDGSAGGTTDGGGSDLAILHPGVFLAVGGVALVGAGLAIWTGLETLSLNDDYNAATDLVEAQRLYDDANTYQLLTNIFIFTSAGLAATAVVLAILTDWDALGGGEDSATAQVRPTLGVGPAGGTLGLEGSF